MSQIYDALVQICDTLCCLRTALERIAAALEQIAQREDTHG